MKSAEEIIGMIEARIVKAENASKDYWGGYNAVETDIELKEKFFNKMVCYDLQALDLKHLIKEIREENNP